MNSVTRNATRVLRGLFLFRLFLVLFAATLLALFWPQLSEMEMLPNRLHPGWLMLPTIFTGVHMFVPRLERKLGDRYLPLFLTLAIISFSLEFVSNYMHPGVQVLISFGSGRQISQYWAPTEAILWVLIPCVLAGATYGVRGAVKAASLATVIHLGLGVVIWMSDTPLHGFLTLLPLRIAVLYVFPIITGSLADTWQREHAALMEANRQLRGYAATAEQLATSRERVRLARDLHDTLTHALAALVVQLEAIGAIQEKQPQAALERVAKLQEYARRGLDESRLAILDLRSSPVEELGLAGAIEQLVQRFQERAGIPAEFELLGEQVPLPAMQANAFYRIAQEGLANVERHAGARHVAVSLDYSGPGDLQLQVSDDGRGFETDNVNDDRMGLVGIFERAELVGARATVDSEPGRGTRLNIKLAAIDGP